MKFYRLSFPVKDLVVTIAYFLIFLLFIFIPSSWLFLFFFFNQLISSQASFACNNYVFIKFLPYSDNVYYPDNAY